MEDHDFTKAAENFDIVISYRDPEELAKLVRRTDEVVREFLREEGR